MPGFHSFTTVSVLNYGVFSLFLAVYMLTLPRRRAATRDLIALFLTGAGIALAYFVAYFFPSPVVAYHRWFTVAGSLYATALVTVFFLDYPEPARPSLRRAFVLGTGVTSALFTLAFIYVSLDAPRVYRFDGHFYDLDMPFMSRLGGILILLYGLSFIGAGIDSVRRSSEPWSSIFFLLAFGLIILVPGVLNILQRFYRVDRLVFQASWNVLGVLGSFICLVVYITHMKERTTLLMKLNALVLVTIMLVLQFVDFFYLRDRDSLFDELFLARAESVIADIGNEGKQALSDEVACASWVREDGSSALLLSDMSDTSASRASSRSPAGASSASSSAASSASAAVLPYHCGESDSWQALQMIALRYRAGDSLEAIQEDLAPPYRLRLGGVLQWLADQELSRDGGSALDRGAVLAEMGRSEKLVSLLQSALRHRPVAEWDGAVEATSGPFLQAALVDRMLSSAREARHSSPTDAGPAMGPGREEVLDLLPAPSVPGERHFFGDVARPERRFVSYAFTEGGLVYVVDFHYVAYQRFHDRVASTLNWLQLAVVAFILLTYPIFFLRILLLPLRRLLAGVEQVDRGDASVSLPVQTEDEIGAVTRGFNQMTERIRSSWKELENHAGLLERRVEERTRELEQSLREVRDLKEAQDADYFLTALLIKPLSTNSVPPGGAAHVDFVVQQKKRFRFRRWDSQIGGDFCTAYRLRLKDRSYVFVVNADAMGKSIQGAGGALVLGAVLESIVDRTQFSETYQNFLPEMWLKRSFVELHRVFESFDGSMLVSLVMALLDEETGLLYYVNAEHPMPVLYRGGHATLFSSEGCMRKLGVAGLEGFLSVCTLQLEPGDAVILGSDGRDDVLVGSATERALNEGPDRFLRCVEAADGEPGAILAALEVDGEPIDDISLLSVAYQPAPGASLRRFTLSSRWRDVLQSIREGTVPVRESIASLNLALQEYPDNVHLHRLAARLYLKERQYGRAILHMEALVRLQPDDEEMLYRLFLLLKKCGLLQRAVEYGEAYHLRHPKDRIIMEKLAEAFHRMGNHYREAKYRRALGESCSAS